MRLFILNIILLLTGGYCLGQKPIVFLDVEPKDAEVGEILTVTVKSNIQGELDIDLPTGFVHGYNVMNGMEQEMDYNTGKVITYYYMSQTGAMNKEGSFTFGPAYIKKGNKAYRSNTVNVTIRKDKPLENGEGIGRKQLNQPAFAVIERSRNTIYEGESVVLNAKIYSHFSPSHLENYQPYTISGSIDKHEIGNSQRILVDEVKVKGVPLFTFSYDKNVVFPSGTGRISVDPCKLILRKGYESVPITSSGVFIEVKPLPKPPSNFMGGVGTFQLESAIDRNELKQGDVFVLSLIISGTGNLHNLINPKLDLPKGFIVYGDPEVKEDFIFGPKGAEGSVRFDFNVQVVNSGNLDFPALTLTYFDPIKEKFLKLHTESYDFKIEKNKTFTAIVDDSKNEPVQLSAKNDLLLMNNSGEKKNNSIFGSTYHWIGIGSPLALALLLGFGLRKRREQRCEILQKKERKESIDSIHSLLNKAENAFMEGNYVDHYAAIEKALLAAITSFLNIQGTSAINKTEGIKLLQEKGVESSVCDRIKLLLEKCEYARFGMGMNEPVSLTENTKDLIKTLERS